MDKNKLRINIKIDGRNYPLYVDRADEERHRLAAKIVNETVGKFKEMFRNKDSQDIVAMTAFQIALSNTEMMQRENESLFIDELKDLNDDISDFLKENRK
ncbi:MAG: cell division protein ZapA [Prolixibacteraceae bacterium]|mgnify:FL=1|nr:cell division protein ZapA [Prolixibacteraceae bacterium]MBT6005202.1 cell division protein ZapA [Prolixibacteraceae bacterium]MBT6766351.1 cell division protein ZapA [Prolixibacteraceae bacterium]MBT6999818.1 cell division protein ZapA [Prolixibacteraceae bacterium]MBT7394717.1 cell division protein ZapA [Prolixibacteraceae bacterium]